MAHGQWECSLSILFSVVKIYGVPPVQVCAGFQRNPTKNFRGSLYVSLKFNTAIVRCEWIAGGVLRFEPSNHTSWYMRTPHMGTNK